MRIKIGEDNLLEWRDATLATTGVNRRSFFSRIAAAIATLGLLPDGPSHPCAANSSELNFAQAREEWGRHFGVDVNKTVVSWSGGRHVLLKG